MLGGGSTPLRNFLQSSCLSLHIQGSFSSQKQGLSDGPRIGLSKGQNSAQDLIRHLQLAPGVDQRGFCPPQLNGHPLVLLGVCFLVVFCIAVMLKIVWHLQNGCLPFKQAQAENILSRTLKIRPISPQIHTKAENLSPRRWSLQGDCNHEQMNAHVCQCQLYIQVSTFTLIHIYKYMQIQIYSYTCIHIYTFTHKYNYT